MKFKKFLVLVLFVVSFSPALIFAKSYSVSAKLDEGIFMVPTYSITRTELDYDNGTAYIVVHTRGDCRIEPVRRCDPSPGHDPYWKDCWIDYETVCNRQTGY